MQHYVGLESGHMGFLIRALDGDAEEARLHPCQRGQRQT